MILIAVIGILFAVVVFWDARVWDRMMKERKESLQEVAGVPKEYLQGERIHPNNKYVFEGF